MIQGARGRAARACGGRSAAAWPRFAMDGRNSVAKSMDAAITRERAKTLTNIGSSQHLYLFDIVVGGPEHHQKTEVWNGRGPVGPRRRPWADSLIDQRHHRALGASACGCTRHYFRGPEAWDVTKLNGVAMSPSSSVQVYDTTKLPQNRLSPLTRTAASQPVGPR